jgi:nitrogen fixation protein NifU and related proteins
MDLYRENILDHNRNPRNFGELDNPDTSHEGDNPFCGDHIAMHLHITHNPLHVTSIKFSGEGCAISIASASMLTEKVKGTKIADLRSMDRNDILKLLGIELSPTRLKCGLLPLEVLKKAAEQYNNTTK